ncbi:TrkH family potassium uptake protein [Galactobacter sp.]|uniref:TrkH family potassium uptake protein n=1 Tax=Galactobacter sp. TaxID=2676125 RepID=UPI0025C63D2C|nr:potassium transporter TrkG [Galactobacter sp.]
MAAGPPPEEDARPNVALRLFYGARDFVDRLAANSPARLAIGVFLAFILVVTILLSLPMAATDGHLTPFVDAFFTAVSAVCVTGLTVVSTAAHWTLFGQVVILVAIFVGGLGILTLASILSLAVSKRLGIRGKLLAQQSLNVSSSGRLGEVGSLLRIVITTSVIIQLLLILWLSARFWSYGESLGRGAWHGVFYAVSAYNNAGFTPHSDGLVPYEADAWLLAPLMLGVFLGSLGFPVVMVLLHQRHRISKWNLHTKLTLTVSLALVFLGSAAWGASEWGNDDTIGRMGFWDKSLHTLFASVMTRSGGFNLVDQSQMHPASLVITDALMFVGGGSASTAGGIKVTTLAVLIVAILAEARGTTQVQVYGRRIVESTLRVAIAVTGMGATLVMLGTIALLVVDPAARFDHALFECISAFATVGLSTGLTETLPAAGKIVLAALMFLGRIGTITFATALSLRHTRQLYHYPEERPIIG